MTDKAIVREVKRLRSKGWAMANAYRAARTLVRFEELFDQGLVRFRAEVEHEQYDDSYIDTWDDLSPAQRKAEKDKLWARIEREGTYYIVAEYRAANGRWESVGTVGGFIGDDYEDSGYDTDLMDEAIEALACEVAESFNGHATFAGAGNVNTSRPKRDSFVITY